MVAQVRAGLNNNVTCPRELGLQDSMQKCPPGWPRVASIKVGEDA